MSTGGNPHPSIDKRTVPDRAVEFLCAISGSLSLCGEKE